MAQNVTVQGASYSDVPGVELPKTGGGTASFYDVSDTTATASDVASGKYFYTAAGVRTEGTSSGGGGSVTVTDEPDSHGGIIRHIAATVTTPVAQATPVISINSSTGLITATATQSAGTIAAGTKSATEQLTIQSAATITPSTSQQTAVASGRFTTGAVIVNPIPSQYIIPSGSISITSNGTVDVSQYASASVNVSGGGGSGLTLLKTQSLGTLSTSSTNATNTNQTVSVTGYNDYDVLVLVISADPKNDGRHTSTVSMIYCTGTSSIGTKNTYNIGSNKWNTRLVSGVTQSRQSSNAYGVYAYSASVSGSTMNIPIYYRYNSTNTGTINGNYTARVYGLKLYELI